MGFPRPRDSIQITLPVQNIDVGPYHILVLEMNLETGNSCCLLPLDLPPDVIAEKRAQIRGNYVFYPVYYIRGGGVFSRSLLWSSGSPPSFWSSTQRLNW
jgi:hypothetical protein